MNKRIKCPVCGKACKGAVGLATHTRRKHQEATGASKRDGVSQNGALLVVNKNKKAKEEAQHGELYSFIVAKLEDIIHRVAFEHDIPERQLAQGFARYLHRS